METPLVVWPAVVILLAKWSLSTQVIPERAEVYYVNKNFMSNASAFIRRYARRSPYYINIQGTLVETLGDNVTLFAVYHEFLHNEYKRSFVELEMKMCDLINKNPWKELIGSSLLAHGFVCPLPQGNLKVHNISISLEKFPYVIPFEKIMVEAHAKFTPTQEIIVRARFFITFKRELPKKI